jgi:osmotically inducible lipoprotein OsmB
VNDQTFRACQAGLGIHLRDKVEWSLCVAQRCHHVVVSVSQRTDHLALGPQTDSDLQHTAVGEIEPGIHMTTSRIRTTFLSITAVLWGLGGCAGMTQQEKGTAIGAGAGAVGGAILSGGGALGTLGGAAVGGVIGHEVSKPKK